MTQEITPSRVHFLNKFGRSTNLLLSFKEWVELVGGTDLYGVELVGATDLYGVELVGGTDLYGVELGGGTDLYGVDGDISSGWMRDNFHVKRYGAVFWGNIPQVEELVIQALLHLQYLYLLDGWVVQLIHDLHTWNLKNLLKPIQTDF